MYAAYYNLKELPFNQSVDPRFTWLSQKQLEALAAFKQNYLDKRGFFLITGEAGTGKTAFTKRLLAEIESKTIVATVTDPDLDKLDFFNWLSVEFNMNVKFKSKGAFLTRFKRFLLEAYQKNINVTLIIDDAHRINQELIQEILTLANIEKAGSKLMSIYFVGQAGFNKILREKQNIALRQSINAHFHLKPLTEDETIQFILYRLKVAGAKAEIFSSRAYHEIYRFSAGYPRMVINICDRAMIAGCASATNIIDKDLIIESCKDLQIAGIKREIVDMGYLGDTIEPKVPVVKTVKEKDREIKTSLLNRLKIRIAPVARTAILPMLLAILGIVAIYFIYQFKSTLLSRASINFDREKTTSVRNEPSVSNGAQKNENESGKNTLLPAIEDEKSIQTEQKRAEISNDGQVLNEPTIDGKIISSNNQSATAADGSSVRPEAVDEVSDVDVNNESSQIKLDTETTSPSTLAEKAADITPEIIGTDTERIFSEVPEIETARESTKREFNMLSRRLALKLKLSDMERQGAEIQKNLLEPKTGRVISAQPANDSKARKDVRPPQSMAKKAYRPEKERQEADFQIGHLVEPKTAKASDALPTEDPESSKDIQPMQPAEKERREPDTRIVRGEPDIEKISGTQLADNAKSKIDVQSQRSVGKEPRPQAPSVKSDLDSKTKTQQKPGTEVAGLGQVNKQGDLRDRLKLKERLESFLEVYCQTYETKDLDHFTTFFAPEAKENDKPFHNLLPKYRHNFDVIEFITYRIELQKYKYNDEQGTINIEGRFFLEWLPGGTNWRRNSGKIFMELQQSGTSFKISRLDYYGDQRKNTN